jgi:hypothetical protein
VRNFGRIAKGSTQDRANDEVAVIADRVRVYARTATREWEIALRCGLGDVVSCGPLMDRDSQILYPNKN